MICLHSGQLAENISIVWCCLAITLHTVVWQSVNLRREKNKRESVRVSWLVLLLSYNVQRLDSSPFLSSESSDYSAQHESLSMSCLKDVTTSFVTSLIVGKIWTVSIMLSTISLYLLPSLLHKSYQLQCLPRYVLQWFDYFSLDQLLSLSVSWYYLTVSTLAHRSLAVCDMNNSPTCRV